MQQVYVNFFNLDVTNIYTIIDYYFEIMQNVRQKNINNLLVPRCPWISNSIDKNLKSSWLSSHMWFSVLLKLHKCIWNYLQLEVFI